MPDRGLLQNLWQYAQDAELQKTLRKLADLVDVIIAGQPIDKGSIGTNIDCISNLLWKDRADDYAALLKTLARESKEGHHHGLTPGAKQVLCWMVTVRERMRLESSVGSIEAQDEVGQLSLETELNLRAGDALKDVESLLHRINSCERSLEAGTTAAKERVDIMRNLLSDYHTLKKLSLSTFPLLEHQTILRAIQGRSEALEKRSFLLASIVNEQNEEEAIAAARGDRHLGLTKEDTQAVANWMLGRYMLSELAPAENRVIKWLLNWKWVLAWICMPFAASAVLNRFIPNSGYA